MPPKKSAKTSQLDETSTKTQQACDTIREWILTLEDSDKYITENRIMVALELNRTPVREALAELQGEGLVEIIPKKGTRVCKPTSTELRSILRLRELIEPSIAQTLAASETLQQEARKPLNEIIGEMRKMGKHEGEVSLADRRKFWELDMKFHAAICSLAEYEPAVDILRQFQQKLRLVPIKALKSRKYQLDVTSEHEKIAKQILAAKPSAQAVRKAVTAHLNNTAHRWGISLSNTEY